MAKAPKNLAASVRQKLLSLARQEQKLFDVVLVAFGLEHLIYRLSVSPHKDKFVLKGGMLVTLWTKDQARFTRDVDFLSFGASDEDALIEIFKDTLDIDAGDGLIFDTADITAAQIREDQIYGGVRLKTVATLANAKIPITIDIGFGDGGSFDDFIEGLPFKTIKELYEWEVEHVPPIPTNESNTERPFSGVDTAEGTHKSVKF